MAGFGDDSLGFDVVYADNVDFSGSLNPTASVLLDGQLLIGSTALPHIRVNTLTAGTGVNIVNGNGSITISLAGGGGAVEHLTGDSGGQLNPSGSNNFNIVSDGNYSTLGATGIINGSGSTLTLNLTKALSSPTPIGNTAANSGAFTTITGTSPLNVFPTETLTSTSSTNNVTNSDLFLLFKCSVAPVGGFGGAIAFLNDNSTNNTVAAGTIEVISDVTTAGAVSTHFQFTAYVASAPKTSFLIYANYVKSAFGQVVNYTSTSASTYTVLATDYYISMDCSGGAKQVNLPNAPVTNQVYIVKDKTGNAGANNITVTTPGGVVGLDGATTFVININYGSVNFIFNGVGYEIF